LLPLLATFGPSRLPLPLFEAGWKGAQTISPSKGGGDDDAIDLTARHVSYLPSVMQADADAWNSFRLVEAVHLLKAFFLVLTDTNDGFLSISMQPLGPRLGKRPPRFDATARILAHHTILDGYLPRRL